MGLDMYLYKHVYIGANYPHRNVTGYISIQSHGEQIHVNLSKVSYIVELAGYWRKANSVHNWFVENVQDGVDDCHEHYVPTESLKELLTSVQAVISAKGTKREAKVIEGCGLSPSGGFFFGSTDVDEWYWQDMEDTDKMLTKLLLNEGNYSPEEYYYRASW